MVGGKLEVRKKYNLFSILAIIFAFLIFPLGLIFAIIALVQIKKSGEKGKGLAIASLIISILFPLLAILFVVIVYSLIKPTINVPSGVSDADIIARLILSFID